jgi:hypothetical protein
MLFDGRFVFDGFQINVALGGEFLDLRYVGFDVDE